MALRRTPLRRDVIARAALRLLDTQGVGSLTMRGLAAELGVKAPSLYHHVSGLDEVIDLVQESVDDEIDRSGLTDHPLREGLTSFARSYRAAFLRHPYVLPYVVRRVMTADNVLALYDDLARFVRVHGVPEKEVLTCMALVDSVVLGTTLDTFQAGFTEPADYEQQYPNLADALAYGKPSGVDDEVFETSLVAVIDEIERRANRSARATTGARLIQVPDESAYMTSVDTTSKPADS